MTAKQRAQLERLLPGHKLQHCTLLERQGHSNQSYLLQTDKARYIVRLFMPSEINRSHEYQIQMLAHTQGITAQPIALDTAQGIMISAFIEGVHHATLSAQSLKQLARTLVLLHSLPYEGENTSLEVDTACIQEYPRTPALCHNDLNPQNILWGSAPMLIDWEYAGINDYYFDLAAVTVEFRLNDADMQLFLGAYFQDIHILNQNKLHAFMALYRRVCEQWWSQQP